MTESRLTFPSVVHDVVVSVLSRSCISEYCRFRLWCRLPSASAGGFSWLRWAGFRSFRAITLLLAIFRCFPNSNDSLPLVSEDEGLTSFEDFRATSIDWASAVAEYAITFSDYKFGLNDLSSPHLAQVCLYSMQNKMCSLTELRRWNTEMRWAGPENVGIERLMSPIFSFRVVIRLQSL